MPAIEIRKRIVTVEDIFHEGGPRADAPYRRAAILSVINNPFAGRYVEDILGFSDDLKPLGLEMAHALIAALGGDPKAIQGYGKGAIVGSGGEIEHGVVMMRTAGNARALARVPAQDGATLAHLLNLDRTPVGSTGDIVSADDGVLEWRVG